uniref:Lipocalin 9 n=1 Tax=Loxodonta africana TaxID=9785 RepID=G3UBN9_LOXAF
MRMALLLLLLGLGLRLATAQQLDIHKIVYWNYDMAKVSGVWYSISMASSNMSRIGKNGDLRVFVYNIESLKNGSLKFSFHFMLQGLCEQLAVVCEKTGRNGEYTIDYEGENAVLILETDYKFFITFYLRNLRDRTQTHVLALYGRIPQLSPIFLDRFRKICQKYGLGPNNIIKLSYIGGRRQAQA